MKGCSQWEDVGVHRGPEGSVDDCDDRGTLLLSVPIRAACVLGNRKDTSMLRRVVNSESLEPCHPCPT